MSQYSVVKEIKPTVLKRWESFQNACPRKLHPSYGEFRLMLPKKFRERRALAIASWYLPDWIKWELIMSLNEIPLNLDFQNKGLSHSIELNLLTKDQILMENYVSELINPRILFGTILREDLEHALQSLKIIPLVAKRPIPIVRRKGYKDKGTWRPPHLWTEKYDFSFTEYQNKRELRQTVIRIFTTIFESKLRSYE